MESAIITNTFHLDVDHEKKICVVTGKGKVNFQNVMEIFQEAEEIPNLKPDYKVLADMSRINFHPSFDEIMAIKNKITFFKENLQNKVAIITEGKITILADLICAFSNAVSIKMKSFQNQEDAFNWLDATS